MFISTSQIKIFLYRHTIDGRWGMDRLFALVDSELHLDPRSGTLFVFFNRNRSLAKVAYYDGSGSCLFYKRLEKGLFKFPNIDEDRSSCEIAPTELALLLEGGNLDPIIKPKPWQPKMRVNSH
jgi:transposase